MKKKTLSKLGLAVTLAMASLSSQAATIGLYDYAFNVDGTITSGSAPSGVDLSLFDDSTGLGSISFSLSGAGSHYFAAFFDHEIDEATNTYFNETGSASGSAAAGQSWEIDEPGWIFGDIYVNFQNSSLDNSNSIGANNPDDVSMAMGWDFTLAAGETAEIALTLGETAPSGGFYLTQFDPDSDAGIYFSGSLKIQGGPPGTAPEPSLVLLLGAGLFGLGAVRRRKVG